MKNILFLIFLVCIFSCSPDGASPMVSEPLAAKSLTNVSYGTADKQKYDIYLPENRDDSTKIVVLVHGGGWNAGDKYEMNDFVTMLKEQLPHLAIVNMNYRLADTNTKPHPMQINDITDVVADLKGKQEEYHIGTELGFIGFSAGGHLSLLWSYAFDLDKQVRMVCSIVGPTNLNDDAYINSPYQNLKDLIFQFGNTSEELIAASPLFKATEASPPTILFYGAQDPLIPNSQGIDLKNKLDELSVINQFTLYPNAGHGWIGLDLWDTTIKLKDFTTKHLGS